MPLAFSKPTVNEAETRTLVNEFRNYGFESLQLKGSQYLPWIDDVDRFRREWVIDPGVATTLITMGTLDPAGRERLRKVIEFAAQVGSERVVFCHDEARARFDEQLRDYAATLSELGKESRDKGVALSLHHHYGQPVMVRHDFEVFFGAVDDGSVGLTVDTAHLAKSGINDIAGFIVDFGSVIDNLHLKDFKNGQWRLLGQGALGWPGIFGALAKVGYSGWLCVDEESETPLVEGLSASAEFMRGVTTAGTS
jgi:Sugar phosphate isomerases/epimerases